MRAIRFEHAEEFERRVTPFLIRHEAENNHFLVLMSRFKEQADTVLCAVEEGGEIVAVATMTPPWHLIISQASPVAAARLADLLSDQHVAVPGIQGVREGVNAFIERWTQ